MKNQKRDRFQFNLFVSLVITMVLSALFVDAEVRGATYYLSTSGSDSASGASSSSPWKTFSHALPRLSPGDTLILANGTYTDYNSGWPFFRCGSTAKNGTASSPITIKAANERQAFLKGDGNLYGILVWDCSYWVFEGLRVESADKSNSITPGQAIYALNSHHLTFRRLLVQKNNRYQNSPLILFANTHNSLIEESELYSFHRHGIDLAYSNNNTLRRNFLNSRDHRDISGGYRSEPFNRGDSAIAIYPGSNNIIENNVIENTGQSVEINAASTTVNNKFFGNISIRNNYGIISRARGNSLGEMPRDTIIENHVALNSSYYGGYFRSTKNTMCKNCTSLNSGYGGFAADKPSPYGDGSPSVYFRNSLMISNGTYGILAHNQANYKIESSNGIGQYLNFYPKTGSSLINVSSVDARMGACKVFIPSNSPLKGKGINGADIGANVLYRYENGGLTNKPLWNRSSGEFSCGAKVAGVNDIAGSSCFDVNKRLNVNSNGCSLPANY